MIRSPRDRGLRHSKPPKLMALDGAQWRYAAPPLINRPSFFSQSVVPDLKVPKYLPIPYELDLRVVGFLIFHSAHDLLYL